MKKLTRLAGSIVLALHGFIHLMGTAVYLKLAEIEGLAYKTTLLKGAWDVGQRGMAFFGLFWGFAAAGFIAAGAIWLLRNAVPRIPLIMTAAFSLVLTLLDYDSAYAGALISGVILALALLPAVFEKETQLMSPSRTA